VLPAAGISLSASACVPRGSDPAGRCSFCASGPRTPGAAQRTRALRHDDAL